MKTISNEYQKSLRRNLNPKSYAFTVITVGVILMVLLLITSVPVLGCKRVCSPELTEVKNYQYEEPGGQCPTIVIDKNGVTWLGWTKLDNNPHAVELIEDSFEEYRCSGKRKVLLKVDGDVSFGKIADVLQLLSRAEVKVVGLITGENATFAHFIKDIKKIWASQRIGS